jgi:O-antigen ligase
MVAKIISNKSLETLLMPSLVSGFTSLLTLLLAPNYFLVFVLVILPFCVFFIFNKPFVLFQTLIIILPFSSLPIIETQLFGIPGLKVINVLVVAIFISFFISKRISNINKNEIFFIVALLSLVLIAVIRSIPHITIINIHMSENFSNIRFFQSFFFKSVINLSPLIIISLYVLDIEKLELVLKTYLYSIFIFSIYLLMIYIFLTPEKTNASSIRESFGTVAHLHGNTLGSFYILSFPLIMSYYLIHKNVFSIASMVLAIIVVGLSFSRTAYLLVPVSIFIYLAFSKRLTWTPIIACLLLVSINFLPNTISERALKGIETNNVNQISAGRVNEIWVPILQELKESPKTLFFGNGIRGLWTTDAFKKGQIFDAFHAHNLYLTAILDIGLIGLGVLALLYIKIICGIFRIIKIFPHSGKQKEILFGVVVSILVFLIAGFSGRIWYPIFNNYPLWIVLAIGSSIVKIQSKKNTLVN